MKQLQKILETNGYDCQSYSGRAMYGKTCLGVVISSEQSQFEMGLMVGLGLVDCWAGDIEAVKNVRSDSMGLGTVVYWPNIEYDESLSVDNSEKIRKDMKEHFKLHFKLWNNNLSAFELAEIAFDNDSNYSGEKVPAKYIKIAKEIVEGK